MFVVKNYRKSEDNITKLFAWYSKLKWWQKVLAATPVLIAITLLFLFFLSTGGSKYEGVVRRERKRVDSLLVEHHKTDADLAELQNDSIKERNKIIAGMEARHAETEKIIDSIDGACIDDLAGIAADLRTRHRAAIRDRNED